MRSRVVHVTIDCLALAIALWILPLSLPSAAVLAGLVLAISAAAENYRADRRLLGHELAVTAVAALLAAAATTAWRFAMEVPISTGPLEAAAVFILFACVGRAATRIGLRTAA